MKFIKIKIIGAIRYLLLFCFIVTGLISIIATGGGDVGSEPEQTNPPTNQDRIKVMSYNVYLSFIAPNPEERITLIIDLILDEDPDIVGLQELNYFNRQAVMDGLNAVYDLYGGKNRRNGETVLLRKGMFTILEEGEILGGTCEPPDLPEGTPPAELYITYLRLQASNQKQVAIYNTHFCFFGHADHAVTFANTVATLFPNIPAIVTGDLNSIEGSDTMEFLLNQIDLNGETNPIKFYDTWALAHENIDTPPGSRIDWVLTTDGDGQELSVIDAAFVEDNTQASDHKPITAVFSFIND